MDAQIYRKRRPYKRPQLWYKQKQEQNQQMAANKDSSSDHLESTEIPDKAKESEQDQMIGPAIRVIHICEVPSLSTWTDFISEHLSLALSSRVCDTIWHQITCRLQIRTPYPYPSKHSTPPLAWPSPLPFFSRTPRRTRSPIWSQQSQKRRTERERERETNVSSLVLVHSQKNSLMHFLAFQCDDFSIPLAIQDRPRHYQHFFWSLLFAECTLGYCCSGPTWSVPLFLPLPVPLLVQPLGLGSGWRNA